MGEIAELMLNGDICEQCGVTLDGDGEGFTRLCRDCARDRRTTPLRTVKCQVCSRRVKHSGLADHARAMHGTNVRANLDPTA